MKSILFSKYSINIPKASSSQLLVIANGPSFKNDYEISPNTFKNNDCIVSNNFALSDLFDEIKPKYYALLDAYMFNLDKEEVKKTWERINNVTWPLHLFVPYHLTKACPKISNKNINLTSYNYNFFRGFDSIGNYLKKINLMSTRSSTITATSIFLGINMGYKIIYLSGADQRWHENVDMGADNILCTKVVHFYDNKEEIKLLPFYKGGDKNNGVNKASDFFMIQYKTFKSYEDVAKYAEYRGAEIINLGLTSFIDAFRKRSITDISI